MTSVAERLLTIQARIADAARASGRDPKDVRLLAVSKGQPSTSIDEAFAAGQREFGENYVQELIAKARDLEARSGIVWHAIGPLQRNKAKDVCRIASVVHTIDRVEIAEEIAKRTTRSIDVLIEVNVAGEAQKAGCAPAALGELVDHVASLSKLRVVGLMAIPPLDAHPEANRPHFSTLRRLLIEQKERGHQTMVELSMGMSADFEVAISEGATIVRVGTAIFGERAPRAKVA